MAAYTQLPLHSEKYLTDPLAIFDSVGSEGAGYFLVLGQGASGYAHGSFGFKPAKVTFDFSMGADSGAIISRGLVSLHENAHEAGEYGYSDRELAIAASLTLSAQGYKNIPKLPSTNDVNLNSQYLTGAIFQACHPRQTKRFMR